jgi:LPXTG-motif cell wall-anchored protein
MSCIITYDTTIFLKDNSLDKKSGLLDFSQFIILGIAAVIGGAAFAVKKRRKKIVPKPSQAS